MPITIRAATPADATAIALIGSTTFSATFGHSMPEDDLAAYLNKYYTPTAIEREISSDHDSDFYVAQRMVSEGKHEGEHRGEGKAVGFLQMKRNTREPCIPSDAVVVELHRIYVSTNAQGEGVGKLLMDRAMQWAYNELQEDLRLKVQACNDSSETNPEKKVGVWLGVWEENYKALKFYERQGYVNIGHHNFTIGDCVQTDFVMVKWL